MVKTPPFHVFHPPSRSLAPRISHQSLPVSTSSVASAKEEPITTSPSHQVPKTPSPQDTKSPRHQVSTSPSLHVTKSPRHQVSTSPSHYLAHSQFVPAQIALKTAVSANPKTTCKRVRCRVLERPRR